MFLSRSYSAALRLLVSLTLFASLAACGSASSVLRHDPVPTYLPADTLFWTGIRNVEQVHKAFGTELLAEFSGEGLAKATKKLEKDLGFSIIDAESLSKAGIDPAQPVGMALLGEDAPGFYGRVVDPVRFRVALDTLSERRGGPRTSEQVGSGQVHRLGTRGRICVAERDGIAMIARAFDSDDAERVKRACYHFAGGAADASLAGRADFEASLRGAKGPQHIYGYVNLPVMRAAELARMKKYGYDQVDDSGVPAQIAAALKADRESVQGFFEGMGGLGFGVHLTGEQAAVHMGLPHQDIKGVAAVLENAEPQATVVGALAPGYQRHFAAAFAFREAASIDWLIRVASGIQSFPLGMGYRDQLRAMLLGHPVLAPDTLGGFNRTMRVHSECTLPPESMTQPYRYQCAGLVALGLTQAARAGEVLKATDAPASFARARVQGQELQLLMGDEAVTAPMAEGATQVEPQHEGLRALAGGSRAGFLTMPLGFFGSMFMSGFKESAMSTSASGREINEAQRAIQLKIDAVQTKLNDLDSAHDDQARRKENRHYAGMGTIALKLRIEDDHLAFAGGAVPTTGSWRAMWKSMATHMAALNADRKAYEAARAPLEAQRDTLREEYRKAGTAPKDK